MKSKLHALEDLNEVLRLIRKSLHLAALYAVREPYIFARWMPERFKPKKS